MSALSHRSHLALALGIMLLTTLGCFGCNTIDSLRGRLGGPPTETSDGVTAPTASVEVDATPWPTLDPSQRIGSLDRLPTEPGRIFEVQISEQEINDRIRGEVLDRDGFAASEPRVTLADGTIVGSVSVTHQESGITVAISVRGKPRVVDGEVFFAIEDVSLGDSIRGVARLLLQGMIDQVLKQVGTETGVPLPLDGMDNMEILAVRVEPGVMIVTGRIR